MDSSGDLELLSIIKSLHIKQIKKSPHEYVILGEGLLQIPRIDVATDFITTLIHFACVLASLTTCLSQLPYYQDSA